MKKFCIIVRKTVALLIVSLLVLSFAGCSNSSSSSSSSNGSYSSSTQKTISTSKKKEIAEEAALKMVLKTMKSKSTFSKYDLDATRYKTGAITEERGKFVVKGTLYLYDQYGSLEDTATFDCSVDVEDDGSSEAYYPIIKIE